MKTISASQLRSRARALVRTLGKGASVALTYRGRKVANISPLKSKSIVSSDDPLYHLHRLANSAAKPLTDRQIDRVVYGA